MLGEEEAHALASPLSALRGPDLALSSVFSSRAEQCLRHPSSLRPGEGYLLLMEMIDWISCWPLKLGV